MIEALLARAAAPLFKVGVVFTVGAGLALGAALVGYKAADMLGAIIIDRVASAVMARDEHWKAEIAAANVKAALAEAAQANQAMKLNSEISAAREAERMAQDQLETANAALPQDAAGGIGRERVRLLNRR
jgi:hypothetical protein